MKIAYLNCNAGISGDMCLGALVDSGVSLKKIEAGLKGLKIKGYSLAAEKVTRASIAATKVDVILKSAGEGQGARGKNWKDIKNIIDRSNLSAHIKQKGLNIFRLLFEAEGKVHGETYDKTHLHELGAVDCMVDIFGTLIGLEALGIEKLYSSAVNLGSGSVRTEHGRLPVPAPATAELLKGVPVYSSAAPSFELTTPTGAAILKGVADDFINLPLMRIETVGNGAGRKDIMDFPNMLRLIAGEAEVKNNPDRLPKVTVIEANIDDMNPQIYEFVMEQLFDAGALDVYLSSVIMKKSRPGVLLTVLCTEDIRSDLINIILKETTSLGVRYYETSRVVLERSIKELNTEFGKVRIKAATIDKDVMKFSAEYEDCKIIARKYKIPLVDVMKLADVFKKS